MPPAETALEPEPEPEPEPSGPEIDPVLEALRMTSQTQADYESLRKLEGGDGAGSDANANGERRLSDGAVSAKPPAGSSRTAASTRREYHFTRPVENLHQGLPAHDVSLPPYLLNGGSTSGGRPPAQQSVAFDAGGGASIDMTRNSQPAAGMQQFTNPISGSIASLSGGGEDKLLPKRPSSRPPGPSFALGASTAPGGPIQLTGSTAVSSSIAASSSNKPPPAVIDLTGGKRPSFDHNSVSDGRFNSHSDDLEEIQL